MKPQKDSEVELPGERGSVRFVVFLRLLDNESLRFDPRVSTERYKDKPCNAEPSAS